MPSPPRRRLLLCSPTAGPPPRSALLTLTSHDPLTPHLVPGTCVGLQGDAAFCAQAIDLVRRHAQDPAAIAFALIFPQGDTTTSWIPGVPRFTPGAFASHRGKTQVSLPALRVEGSQMSVPEVVFSMSAGVVAAVQDASTLQELGQLVAQMRQPQAVLHGTRAVGDGGPEADLGQMDWVVCSAQTLGPWGVRLGAAQKGTFSLLSGRKAQWLEALGRSRLPLVRRLDGVKARKRVVFASLDGYRLDSRMISAPATSTLHLRRETEDVTFWI